MRIYDPNGPEAALARRRKMHIPTWGAGVWCDDCGDWITSGFVQKFYEAGLGTLVTPNIWPVNLNWIASTHKDFYVGHNAHVIVVDVA